MSQKREVALWRSIFGSILSVGILAILDVRQIALDKGFSLMQPKWLLLLAGVGILTLLGGFLFSLTWSKYFQTSKASLDAFLRFGEKAKWLWLAFFFISLWLLVFVEIEPYLSDLFGSRLWMKLFLFLLIALLGAIFLQAGSISRSWAEAIAFAALGQLLVYQLAISSLYITNYPFAIGWTRDSRYYYASLFFAEKLYGQKLPLPILHPTLHFLFSFPFLFGKAPLWVHRGWSLLLTFGLTWAAVASLARRFTLSLAKIGLKREDFSRGVFLVSIWAFLFLLRGSIYAHLLVPTLLIFLFVSPEKKWQSWVAVILASFWAGMSRINWFPVPAMLAALIYFLEVPQKEKKFLAYLKRPVLWFGVGVAAAFFSQAAYIQLSGNGGREEFFTSLASDLLWYRLLPNATYRPGIILGALLLSFPLMGGIFFSLRAQRGAWRPLRIWGLFTAVFVLFVGGLVVSAKIGGGADLHNMDAYFVSILLVGTALIARGFVPDTVSKHLPAEIQFSTAFVAVALLAGLILPGRGSLGYDRGAAEAILSDLQAQATRVVEQGEDVLFIAQRHLLPVGLIEGVPLIPNYEKDVLMEMSMARNKAYLDDFYDALHNQKYGLIVVDTQSDTMLSEDRSFAVENNRWILKVTRPLWCYYEPLTVYESVGIELYIPRAEPENCD